MAEQTVLCRVGYLGFSGACKRVVSGNVVAMLFGTVTALSDTSAFLMHHVKNEHRTKRCFGRGLCIVALVIVVHGYVVTSPEAPSEWGRPEASIPMDSLL